MRLLREVFRANPFLVVVVVASGAACVPVTDFFDILVGNPVDNTTAPGEMVLTITRRPAFGWCPYENMLLDVSVVRDIDGRYILTGSKTVESSDPAVECTHRDISFVPSCFVTEDLAPTVLADQNAMQLERSLSGLPPRDCDGGFFRWWNNTSRGLAAQAAREKLLDGCAISGLLSHVFPEHRSGVLPQSELNIPYWTATEFDCVAR